MLVVTDVPFCIQFYGFTQYKRQVVVLRVEGEKLLQPTKGALALHAAREMRRFMVSICPHLLKLGCRS